MNGQQAPIALRSGDLVLFPQNAWHMISASSELEGDEPIIVNEGDGPITSMICGSIHFRSGHRNPLLAALPRLILVKAETGGSRLESLARIMTAEVDAADFGSDIVNNKLADVLFVLAVRHYIQTAVDQRGVLAALADPALCRALSAIHADPGHGWTVASLASRAGMSRTAFSNRFGQMVGESPISYLTNWRMQQAEHLMRTQGATVAAMAEQFGYETETAFRRAFKRVTRQAPGVVRRTTKAT
jgi:AraC-like DNA-binding protein